MPIISAIKPQKNKKRVNIYLDGKFAFGLDLENYLKSNLKVEQILSDSEIEDIVKTSEFQKILDRIVKFTTLRPRSGKEVDLWLKRKKVHESIRESLFDRLKQLDLIDDNKFARWWVEQRMQFKLRSKRELVQELRIKGIDKEIIEDVLSEVEIDEEGIAIRLLKKNIYKYRNLDKYTARRKMSEFLARKGFGWGLINKVVDKIGK